MKKWIGGWMALLLLVGQVGAAVTIESAGHQLHFSPSGVVISGDAPPLHFTFVEAHPQPALQQQADGVSYAQLWPGIDLHYDTEAGIVRSTYTLEPGADPRQIRLHYNAPLALNPDGSLHIERPGGFYSETPPIAWQVINGKTIPVEVAFALHGTQQLGFALGAYQPEEPLIIDPVLEWHQLLGDDGVPGEGATRQELNAIVHDANGNLYVAGRTEAAWDHQAAPVSSYSGLQDLYLAKMNPAGELLWHTYLGGDMDDRATVLLLEGDYLYVAGTTASSTWSDVATSYGQLRGESDLFIARLNATSGAAEWVRWIGGPGVSNHPTDLAIHQSGSDSYLYLTGYSSGGNWEEPGLLQAANEGDFSNLFVARLAAGDGAVQWHSFYGAASGDDRGTGIAMDAATNTLYIAGDSMDAWSYWEGETETLPLRGFTGAGSGNEDILLLALDLTTGAYQRHTFLGGSGRDRSSDYRSLVRMDGQLYLLGNSFSFNWGQGTGLPLRPHSGERDIVVVALGSDLAFLPGDPLRNDWYAFYGGSGDDHGYGFLSHPLVVQRLLFSGHSSQEWEAATAVQRFTGGRINSLIAQIDSNTGALLSHSFYGISGEALQTRDLTFSNERLILAGNRTTFRTLTVFPFQVSQVDGFVSNFSLPGYPALLEGTQRLAHNSTLDFGAVDNWSSLPKGLTLRNIGMGALAIHAIGEDNPAYSDLHVNWDTEVAQFRVSEQPQFLATFATDGILESGEQVPFEVLFDPEDLSSTNPGHDGTFASFIQIKHDGVGVATPLQLNLTGTGEGRPALQVLGSDQAGGELTLIPRGSLLTTSELGTLFAGAAAGSTGATHTFVMQNQGSASLDFENPAITIETSDGLAHFTPSSEFTAIGGKSGEEAEPHQDTFTLQFTPKTGGDLRGTVTLHSNDQLYRFAVAGSASGPSIGVSGNNADISAGSTAVELVNHTDFGEVFSGDERVRRYTVTNFGTQGSTLTLSTLTLTNTTRAGFRLVNPLSGSVDLAAGQSYTFDVAFQATTLASDYRATVTMTSNDPKTADFTFVVGGAVIQRPAPQLSLTGNDQVIAHDAEPSADNYTDFGELQIGESLQYGYVLRNSGPSGSLLQLTSVSLVGESFAFATPLTPTTLASGESQAFGIAFEPTGDGVYNAALALGSNDSTHATFTMNLSGLGASTPPDLAVSYSNTAVTSGSTTALGSELLARTLERTFTLTNNGPAGSSLEISGITASGDFAFVGNPPPAIASGASANFTIAFTPTQTGTRTGEVTISSNDPEQGSFAFTASGTGEKGKITLDKSHLTVRERDTGYQQVMVTLPSPPLHEVTMAFSLSKNGEIAVATEDSGGLTFTPGGSLTKWLRVSSMNTPELTIDQTITVHGTTTTSDPAYSGVRPTALTVTKRKRYYSDDCSEQPSLAITVATGETKVCRLSSGTLDLSGTTVQPGGQAMFIAPAVRTSGVTFASGATVILGTHHEALDLSESTIISEGRPAN